MADEADRGLRVNAQVRFDFAGVRALITSGTSGIGLATAALFRDAGADVTVTGTRTGAADYDTDLSGMAVPNSCSPTRTPWRRWRAS